MVADPDRDDPMAGEPAAVWRARRHVLDALVAQADRGRRAAVEEFKDLFGPGNIVGLALDSSRFG